MGAFFSILPAKVQLKTLTIICKTNVKIPKGGEKAAWLGTQGRKQL